MAGPLDVVVRFLGDSKQLQTEVGKVEKTGSKLKSWAKGAGVVMAGAFAIDFGKDAIGAAREAEEATKRLDNVFKSMGDTTGKAAEAAKTYATELSKQTAISDETIMAGQAMLATFANVNSETSRAAGIFDRATAAGADLAAAGFGSVESNAVLLGKALNDPAKGLAKLAKQGVTFTEQQKEQITAMQEAGDMAGAQALILAEVEKQVGGTAAATASSTDKMSNAYGEMQESIGTAMLEVMESIAPIVQVITEWIQKNPKLTAAIAGFVAGLWAINIALSANPVVAVIAGIAALVAGLVIAYHKVDWFRAAIDWLWQAIQSVFHWIVDNWKLLATILGGPIGIAVALIVSHWDKIKRAAVVVYETVKRWFGMIVDFISGVVGRIRQYVTNIQNFFKGIGDSAMTAYNTVKTWLGKIAAFVQGIVDSVRRAVGNVANAIKNPINAVIRAWNRFRFPEKTFDTHAGWLPGVPDSVTVGGWDLPNIPELAKGGMVARTGLALVHEGEQFSGVGNTFGSPTYVTIHVDARGATDPYSVGREVERAVVNWNRVSGNWRPGRAAS